MAFVKLTIPAGETDAGTYLVTWNGHGDALALYRIDPTTGALTLANSYTYTTWGAPTTATHNGIGDLGFRFLYVGEYDVQWDNAYGLGLTYMHARHYSPALGRFVQPDPDGDEANLYAYAKNDPVSEIDPDGTCFIVCGIINAVLDTAIYLATTDRSQWSWQGAAVAAGTGFVTGALGFGLLSKFSKIGSIARFASRFSGFGRGRGAILGVAGRVGRPRASYVRSIRHGERASELVNELKRRTFRTGREHAIVSYGAGRRAIVRGGRYGMSLSSRVRRVIAHTHPYGHGHVPGPSWLDRLALRRLGQRHSYVIDAGRIYRYGPD